MVWYEVMYGGHHGVAMPLRFRTREEAKKYLEFLSNNDPNVLADGGIWEVDSSCPTFFDDAEWLITAWKEEHDTWD